MKNWAGNVTFSTSVLHRPTTVEQVQDLVASAPLVRALGSGHSFNAIADTTGALVSVRELAGDIVLGDDVVTFPAGTRYGELTPVLAERGRALHNLGSLPHISVAGACATGTHGSGSGNGSLPTAVRALEFVAGDGSLVRLAAGDPSFGGAVLALGALGIVTSLTLATQPTYEVRQDVFLDLPLPTYLARLDEIMDAGYSVSVFTTWQRPDVLDLLWIKSRGADAPDGFGARAATTPQHPVPGEDGVTCTEQLGVPGPWHARLPHFRLEFTPSRGDEVQSEWFVAREHAADAVAALRSVAARIAPSLLVCEFRTVAADGLWLSPMRSRDSLALHFTWRPDVETSVIAQVEAALAPLEPRPHWGKAFVAVPESEGLPAFRELIERYDPQHRFGNACLERYVY